MFTPLVFAVIFVIIAVIVLYLILRGGKNRQGSRKG
jgi:preprotein translocase subunit YajC